MTFHYHREDVGNLRRVVREAMNKRGGLAELQDLDRRLEEYQNYEDYLVSTKQGFALLRNAQAKGNIVISLSGICPGTTCDKGWARIQVNLRWGRARPAMPALLIPGLWTAVPSRLSSGNEYTPDGFAVQGDALLRATSKGQEA